MPAELAATIEEGTAGRPVVVFEGEVDTTNVDVFAQAIDGAGDDAEVIADLTGLTYLDSAGVQVLFAAARRRRLSVVAGPDCLVRRVLEVAGLHEVATVGEDRPAT